MLTSRLLRFALVADATATAATGLLMVGASGMLETLLGIPGTLLSYAGLALLPYAGMVGYLGTRARTARVVIWAVIAANAAWAIDSVLLLLSGWIEPTMLGYGFIIAQALIVAGFAELQYLGLRQSSPEASAIPAAVR